MKPYLQFPDFSLYVGDVRDVLAELPDGSVDCCITSPPYWGLRDYGVEGQLGLEDTPDEFVANMVEVFREVRRVLVDRGTLWLNLGDSYSRDPGKGGSGPNGKHDFIPDYGKAREIVRGKRLERGSERWGGGNRAAEGLKEKDLVGTPWRVAFALQADGWYLRSDIIWAKPNPMPESVTDRPTKAHEYVFLLAKQPRYYFDQEAVREPHQEVSIARAGRARDTAYAAPGQTPQRRDRDADGVNPSGRNVRSVWEIATQPYAEAHFATYPQELVRRCLLAGCPVGGTVLDPFVGSGTTAFVARKHNRRSVGIELNPDYAELCAQRMAQQTIFSESL